MIIRIVEAFPAAPATWRWSASAVTESWSGRPHRAVLFDHLRTTTEQATAEGAPVR
ncbi:hypothetical protein ACFZC3_29230 [Streptomyces sp. NPDC007903]|uniref:hypothetical protein n=1 Tax=Streptomyces sp. NPDC007903 TaxID=3364786 RepID=UPI0036E11452